MVAALGELVRVEQVREELLREEQLWEVRLEEPPLTVREQLFVLRAPASCFTSRKRWPSLGMPSCCSSC